jgi:ribosomal protein S18 acetylase RimI-like enzyme
MEIKIKELLPTLVNDFLYFFDNLAFTDNPEWSSCYCYCHHANCSSDEWKKRTAKENRDASLKLITAGKMHGYLAYIEDKPVAWCHADSRDNIASLRDICNEPKDGKDKIGSIICFIVAPEYRRKGIAAKLLESVCDGFRSHGYSVVEAYPKKTGKSDAKNYHGPLDMYLKYGFDIIKEDEGIIIVRKRLED